jgi:hypothetical protein
MEDLRINSARCRKAEEEACLLLLREIRVNVERTLDRNKVTDIKKSV